MILAITYCNLFKKTPETSHGKFNSILFSCCFPQRWSKPKWRTTVNKASDVCWCHSILIYNSSHSRATAWPLRQPVLMFFMSLRPHSQAAAADKGRTWINFLVAKMLSLLVFGTPATFVVFIKDVPFGKLPHFICMALKLVTSII